MRHTLRCSGGENKLEIRLGRGCIRYADDTGNDEQIAINRLEGRDVAVRDVLIRFSSATKRDSIYEFLQPPHAHLTPISPITTVTVLRVSQLPTLCLTASLSHGSDHLNTWTESQLELEVRKLKRAGDAATENHGPGVISTTCR
jgi:hypothetical protein